MTKLLLLFVALALTACARPQPGSPALAGATQRVGQARGSVGEALVSNRSAAGRAGRIRTLSERIDAKAAVILEYWE